jgi:hypothetical protein
MVEQLSLTLTSERGAFVRLSYGRLRNGKHKHYTHSFANFGEAGASCRFLVAQCLC